MIVESDDSFAFADSSKSPNDMSSKKFTHLTVVDKGNILYIDFFNVYYICG